MPRSKLGVPWTAFSVRRYSTTEQSMRHRQRASLVRESSDVAALESIKPPPATALVRYSEHRRRLALTANAAALSDLNLREDEQ